jgi:ABC-type sulfate/molybdate transport systems ATPase subunit
MFKHGNLLDNVRFGTAANSPDGKVDRVLQVLHTLGAGEDMTNHIKKNDVHPWGDVLSQTQGQLINLARALVFNPEVLCIHKPTQHFDKESVERVTGVLRLFVDERGVAQDPSKKDKRRPRTLVITTSQRENLDAADMVFKVSTNTGVRLLSVQEYPEFGKEDASASQSLQ